jgi:hypothetical protein
MSRRGVLVVLIVGLACGAVGFLLGREGAPAPPAPAREERSEPAARTGSGSVAPAPDGDPRAVPAETSGTGVIEGRVVTENDEPVTGVVVRATPRSVSTRGKAAPDRSLETRMRDLARRHARERQAVTGTDGAYRLEGLVDGHYVVRAWREGWQFWHRAGREVRTGTTVDIHGRRIATLTVTLLMPDGTEATSGYVDLKADGASEGRVWSPEDRAIVLTPRRWTVEATGGELGELVSERETVTVSAESPTAVTLRLRETPGLRGRVTFEDGVVDGLATVAVRRLAPDEVPDPASLNGSRPAVDAPRRGAYALRGLASGRYLAGVLVEGRLEAHRVVTVGSGMTDCDFVVPAPARSEFLLLTALGPDGRPLRSLHGPERMARLPDGTYRIRSSVLRQRPERWRVRVGHHRYGTREIEVPEGPAPTATVRFETPGTLLVTVEAYGERAVGGTFHLDLETEDHPYGDVDHEGRCRFDKVVPGRYPLHLLLHDRGRTERILTTEIEVRSGENAASLALPALHTVTVLAPRLPVRHGLSLRRVDGTIDRHEWTGDDRRAVWHHVPAGAYELRADDAGESMRIDVPGATIVRFEARPYDALVVTVTDPAGFLARSGLRDGDRLVAVNGTEFTGPRQMNRALVQAVRAGPVRLAVLRGGARLTVTVDFRPILDEGRDALGGRLDPGPR